MSKLYDQATRRTLKEIRALRVGDVINSYRQDSEEVHKYFVTQCSTTSKAGDQWDVMVLPMSGLGKRWSEPRRLATDRFDVVGILMHVTSPQLSDAVVRVVASGIPNVAKLNEPGTATGRSATKTLQSNTPKSAKPTWSNAQVNAAFEKAGRPTFAKTKR